VKVEKWLGTDEFGRHNHVGVPLGENENIWKPLRYFAYDGNVLRVQVSTLWLCYDDLHKDSRRRRIIP
jgi:hypothetical protein